MFKEAVVGTVRADWSFDVAHACQRFAGGVLEPEPDELVRAVNELRASLPVPVFQLERVVLRDRLRITTDNASHQFHALFHRQISFECHDRSVIAPRPIRWDDSNSTPDQLLARWVESYLEEFERLHVWPSPMRAARLIRHSFERPFDARRNARTVGCARSALTRSFKDAYGMSMGHYLTRCRVGAAFGPLRDPDSNVGAIAFGVGYQSTKNLYRALHELTGMTPSQVRQLTNEEAARVRDTQLRLPPPHVRTQAMKSVALSF
jgi:AraC-like DNA-binding protein